MMTKAFSAIANVETPTKDGRELHIDYRVNGTHNMHWFSKLKGFLYEILKEAGVRGKIDAFITRKVKVASVERGIFTLRATKTEHVVVKARPPLTGSAGGRIIHLVPADGSITIKTLAHHIRVFLYKLEQQKKRKKDARLALQITDEPDDKKISFMPKNDLSEACLRVLKEESFGEKRIKFCQMLFWWREYGLCEKRSDAKKMRRQLVSDGCLFPSGPIYSKKYRINLEKIG